MCDCENPAGTDFEKGDIIKFERRGWRLPTVKELKDLFAHNLLDYNIRIVEVLPMIGDKLLYENNYHDLRYIAKDDKNNLLVYNATKDITINPTANDKNKVSGMCLLIKAE